MLPNICAKLGEVTSRHTTLYQPQLFRPQPKQNQLSPIWFIPVAKGGLLVRARHALRMWVRPNTSRAHRKYYLRLQYNGVACINSCLLYAPCHTAVRIASTALVIIILVRPLTHRKGLRPIVFYPGEWPKGSLSLSLACAARGIINHKPPPDSSLGMCARVV